MSKTARRDLDSHSAFSGHQAAILTWREQRSEQNRVALETRSPLRHLGMTTTALRVRASSFCGRLEADLGHHGKIILLLRSAVLTLAEQHRNPRLSNSLRQ